MTKYKTGDTRWGVMAEIEPVEVDKDTDSSVWIRGRRRAKVSEYEVFHDTWQSAHEHLLRKATERVESLIRQLEWPRGDSVMLRE